jgi:DNA-binding XRE family transcriptional regulator
VTPDQYSAAIKRLGMTQGEAAKFLDISIRSSHGYANGEPIPEAITKLLRLMVRLEIAPAEAK